MASKTAAAVVLLTLVGCATPAVGPLVVVSANQAGLTARERGYVACASALYRAYPARRRLWLTQSYQSAPLADTDARLFRIRGYLDIEGDRRQVEFECTTERSLRARVLSLSRLSSFPFDN